MNGGHDGVQGGPLKGPNPWMDANTSARLWNRKSRWPRACYPPRVRAAWVTTALVLSGWASPALAQGPDYATDSGEWNSVSRLIQIARDRQIPVETPDRLDVGTLQPTDSLLILHPREALPAPAVTAFLRAGGRAALADDFGAGDALLEVFQISRAAPDARRAPQLRGNPELLLARPRGRHRLTEGVAALGSNHPAMVHHRELAPIFELSEGEALVLAGAVGSGRLVVLSDPSVLIDNMLELRDNRRFAENLLSYLDDGRGGTLYVIGPEATLAGRFGEPGADRPLHDLRSALESLAHLELPPLALRIAALALAAIALVLAFGALPRQTPYRTSRMFARAPSVGGFAGRVAFFGRKKVSLLAPLLVYKFELEAALLEHLGLGERTLLRDVLDAMRARGAGEADVSRMRTLLLELDRLRAAQDEPPGAPHIGARRFRQLVAEGEQLLSTLEVG